MNIQYLAYEYKKQYEILSAKLDGLRPLLYIYSGAELDLLIRKMNIYYNMACHCQRVYYLLSTDYEEDLDD